MAIAIDEALRQIREAWSSNADYLDDLKQRLTSAHPIPLVPFVGAGLSIPMGFPSWSGFLKLLAAECGQAGEVAALLADGKYEDAAEVVEQGLGPAIFNKRVSHTFGERKSQSCELHGAVLALPDLTGGAIVTTNFDRILERVFADAGSPFEHVARGAQVDSMRRAVAENKPFLLKIHGDADERTGRVLTKREYQMRYAPGDPAGLRAQLGRVFQGRTLLFVGCGLGADRTMDVLVEVLKQASGLEHFAIIEKPALDHDFFAKQKLLGDRGILPIWYSTGRHDLIEPLLRWIASLQPSRRVSGPDLVLERPSQRKKEIRSELDLLIPYQRTTALVGRTTEMESLRAWLRSAAEVSVTVLTGSGGSGKTRLAVELIEWVEDVESGQWNCGFLTLAEMQRFSSLQNLSQWRRRRPVLAVVDYAAGCSDMLQVWLEQLTAAGPGSEKLRMLLLERAASLESGWLASALSRGHSAAAVRALLDPPEPVRLEVVAEATDRRAVLGATVEAGASLRGGVAPQVPGTGLDNVFDRRLEESRWGDPLTLMMAGLTALDTGLVAAMALDRRDMAFRLADRERGRVERFGQGAPAGLMEHMAAYVTVSGGLSLEELHQATKAESEAIGRLHPGGWGVLAERVCEALPGGEGAKEVEPDVIGEALLLRTWSDAQIGGGRQAVVRAAKVCGQKVAASIVRAAQDFSLGQNSRLEPLEWLDALIADGKRDLRLLRQIERELPTQTLTLRERAVKVDEMLAAALGEQAVIDENVAHERASVLNNLGIRLSDLGRREDALHATEEAVGSYRQLAAQRPDAFPRDLARSLNNLGNLLSDLGRREDALHATEEAVQIRRRLAAQRPDAFLPDLATSLNNLGIRLSDLGRREDALHATEEAVGSYRQLAAQRPDAFPRDLARSLNNLGNLLSDLGRREDALQATEEAVGSYRQLAAQRPDAFLADLARSLNNLGIRLSDLGRREDALQATEEAVGSYRQLAAQRPDAFLPDLAKSLNNLGNLQSDLGRREDALRATEEAVGSYRQLAAQRPDAFLPDLAMSLGARGIALSKAGQTEAAVAALHEGMECLKPMFLNRPKLFRPLMTSLLAEYSRLGAMAELEEDSSLLAGIHRALSDDPSEVVE